MKRAAVLLLLSLSRLLGQPGCSAYEITTGNLSVSQYTCGLPFLTFSVTGTQQFNCISSVFGNQGCILTSQATGTGQCVLGGAMGFC
jgi:hypothetical protein